MLSRVIWLAQSTENSCRTPPVLFLFFSCSPPVLLLFSSCFVLCSPCSPPALLLFSSCFPGVLRDCILWKSPDVSILRNCVLWKPPERRQLGRIGSRVSIFRNCVLWKSSEGRARFLLLNYIAFARLLWGFCGSTSGQTRHLEAWRL